MFILKELLESNMSVDLLIIVSKLSEKKKASNPVCVFICACSCVCWCVCMCVCWCVCSCAFSVLSGAPAGSGSSGASPGQTGPEGGVDPQWQAGQPAGGAAESALQPHPDPAALHQAAARPGETWLRAADGFSSCKPRSEPLNWFWCECGHEARRLSGPHLPGRFRSTINMKRDFLPFLLMGGVIRLLPPVMHKVLHK